MTLHYVELFAGMGGLSLGLDRAGMKCVAHVEIEKFPRRVLRRRWKGVPLLSDVRLTHGGLLVKEYGPVDACSGGSPCQDLSVAGARDGLSDGSTTAAGASLSFSRFHFSVAAQLVDGRKDDHRGSWSGKLEAPWECTTDAQRLRKAKPCYLNFPRTDKRQSEYEVPRHPDGTVMLPALVRESNGNEWYLLRYTEGVWATLEMIVRRLHETRAQLIAMVSTVESVSILDVIGRQLMAGTLPPTGGFLQLKSGAKK